MSADEAAERERQFFSGERLSGVSAHVSEALKKLSANQKGKQALIDLLLRVQGAHLRDSLIPFRRKVFLDNVSHCTAWSLQLSHCMCCVCVAALCELCKAQCCMMFASCIRICQTSHCDFCMVVHYKTIPWVRLPHIACRSNAPRRHILIALGVPDVLQVTDKIMSKELELGRMAIAVEDDYAAMQQLVGLSAEMVKGFESLKQGMYSNVNIDVADNLHLDPRIREFLESFRNKV